MHLERVPRACRRLACPEILDQPIHRDDLAVMQEEIRQQSELLRRAEPKRLLVVSDLERS
jgi:hypothetical protein